MAKKKSNTKPPTTSKLPVETEGETKKVIQTMKKWRDLTIKLGDQQTNDSEKLATAISVLSDSDSYLGGTVAAANNSVQVIDNHLRFVDNRDSNYELIRNELDSLKQSIQEIEEIRTPIKKVEEFIKNNVEFMLAATETKGRLNIMQSQLDSVQKRLDGWDDRSNKRKEHTISVWAIIIPSILAIASIVIAILK